MPEYLAPGVYVEETSFRSKSIEGVSTSTAAFVGATRKGPIGTTPPLLTSYPDFERVYGGPENLDWTSPGSDPRNYLALAVQQYFENGGRRLYVSRAFTTGTGTGQATFDLGGATVLSRVPGNATNGTVTFEEKLARVSGEAVGKLPVGTVLTDGADTPTVLLKGASGWAPIDGGAAVSAPTEGFVCTVSFQGRDLDGKVQLAEGMGYDKSHPMYVGDVLAPNPSRLADRLENIYALQVDDSTSTDALRTALVGASGSRTVTLTQGNDGAPLADADFKSSLALLELLQDVSIVAAPGHTEMPTGNALRVSLLAHVAKTRLYRVAVLDSAKGDTPTAIRTTRGGIDNDHAALYYPWVTIANPLARPGRAIDREIEVPPSGAICGIYARNDVERGVWKTPANEVVQGALRFESDVSQGENEALNPLGINCLRYFPGRGYRVWGGRTASSDPEWKYLSVRRYFNYLEASIERGTQWAVFEPNGAALWQNVTETISSFLFNEWRQGALLGGSPEQAYFVRCDRSTMTQNDLDNGRLVCLVGVAVVKPAEFVIFRIGQATASTRE